MEIAFFYLWVYLGAIKGIYLGVIKGIYLGVIKGIYLGATKGRRRGRIRVLTHFSLSYRFPIILPVSELVVYRDSR